MRGKQVEIDKSFENKFTKQRLIPNQVVDWYKDNSLLMKNQEKPETSIIQQKAL